MAGEVHKSLDNLKVSYCRASRCWRSNNLRSCLKICNELTRELGSLTNNHRESSQQLVVELARLKNLVWFLKIRCLADDYYVNESLLLNEDDIDSDDQVRTFSSATRQSVAARLSTATRMSMVTGDATVGKRLTTGTSGIVESRQRTAILTGKMASVSSRHSGRATTSYRPLTTSLTATQTAFSRSTRPILKYSTSCHLSKPLYEYLYNAQTVANKCPDYRQCLEYLNLVRNSLRKQNSNRTKLQDKNKKSTSMKRQDSSVTLIQIDDANDDGDSIKERRSMGTFWLLSYGICYFNLHMNKEAEEYFKLAAKTNSKCLDAYTWLVKIYLRSNQPIKVVKVCEKGLINCKNPILYNWLARVQSLICDSYAANLSLRESLVYYPTNLEALANVGHFSFYGDKLEQALKCFERIDQLTANQLSSMNQFVGENPASQSLGSNSTAELLNNLAICNFYCGNYHKVIPLFQRAFLSSPSKEITSDIWYNVSFIPISCGMKNLAIACLKLAIRNDSQNEEAINNLGVLKYGQLINDTHHYENKQEQWANWAGMGKKSSTSSGRPASTLANLTDQQRLQQQAFFNEVETYFCPPVPDQSIFEDEDGQPEQATPINLGLGQPEMLYNMAVVKRRRGQLLASSNYCKLYLETDQNNYIIRNLQEEIKELISHDS